MVGLIVVGIVAGFLAGISPCILPVLPVVLVAGASAPESASPPASAGTPARMPKARLARSLAVIGGLVVSFSIIVLAGSEILSLLHLPQDALRDAGIALLIVVGLGYLIPPLGALIERPFARVGTRQPSGRAGGFVLGLAVGVLYVPCAGPVLAAITVVGATHRVGLTAVVSSVRAQAAALGVRYPVAIDNNYATWNAYSNQYWPADYLIDAQGNVRSVHFGESGYSTMGQLIRQLLQAARPHLSVPTPAGVPDKTPAGQMTPRPTLATRSSSTSTRPR